MKKLLFCGAAAAIIAGCSSREEPVVVFDATCEKVATFDSGNMVVKCPMTRILTVIQQQGPNNKFEETEGLDLAKMAADTEHAYVNILPMAEYRGQTGKTQYRVMVPNADVTSERWAVALIAD